MADPFVSGEDAMRALEADVKRMRQENRELRLTNTNLRARLALVTPDASLDSEGGSTSGVWQRHLHVPAARSTTSSEAETRRGASASSHAGGDAVATAGHANAGIDAPTDAAAGATAAPTPRRTRGAAQQPPSSSGSAAASEAVSAARIQEAIQRVKQELQGELETSRRALAAEKAAKEHLKREFELFVSTTCEREAAYQLVHSQLFREAEEHRARLQAAQAQLEEQRQQSVEMRRSLEAAVVAARAEGAPPSTPALAVAAEDDAASHTAKRRRTTKEGPSVPGRGPREPKLPTDVDWSGLAAPVRPAPAETPPDSASVAESSQADSTAPRPLNIVSGAAALRNAPRKLSTLKRQRELTARTSLARVPADVGLHVPVAPVFARGPPAAVTVVKLTDTTAAVAVSASTASSLSSSPTAVASARADAPPAASGPVEALWRLLANHTEVTQGFLPLWQQLATLSDAHRLTALEVVVTLLVHLVGPQGSSATAFTARTPAAGASLPPAFVSQPSSIAVVATAVRLLTVQMEDAAQQQQQQQQQRGLTEAGRKARGLLSTLFYRLCVAALCRWQDVDGARTDALEHWSTAVLHLYGFQLDLERLMQYTNTTTAYYRTRLSHSWISFFAQCIFGQCFTASSPSLSSTISPEAAASRWRELCDSVGWSTHALPLERLETAAARCVAMARVGHGPFTAACAEEALLALRLGILYEGFDHMEQLARLLEQPGVLPMAMTKDIYAELVSLAVRDAVPFRTQAALHHALGMLKEYVTEAAPERCTSAEHFVCSARRSHLMAALALLGVGLSTSTSGGGVRASEAVAQAGRRTVLRWLQEQKAALEMVRESASLPPARPLLLRDTPLGRTLLRHV